jgi:two-component system, NarL family, sensor kinase
MLARGRPLEVFYANWLFHNAPTAVVCLWLGRMVLSRRPRHTGGLLLTVIGAFSSAHVAAIALADARLLAAGMPYAGGRFEPFVPADLPLDAALPAWFSTWLWIPAAGMAVTLLLLVFPDGRLPGPRWRWVPPVAAVSMLVLVVAYMIEAWPAPPTS